MPVAWRGWCERQGWQRQADAGWELLGLTPAPSGFDAAALLAGTRFGLPDFPADLLPIEQLPERQLACIRVDGRDDPPVVIVDLDDPRTWQESQPPAFKRFSHYADDFMDQAHALRRVADFLRRRQADIKSGRRPAGQAPRPDDWRVYRFCSQNVVVAMVLLRFNRDDNVLDVGACLITALSALDPDAPARALCTLLLAEAYRSGGDLSFRFVRGTGRTAPASMPRALCRWAERVGVALDRRRGKIDRDTALRLFIEAVNVGDELRGRLRASQESAAAICHGIASGLWHPAEVEILLAWSTAPGSTLRGLTNPIDRARYACDILDVRAAMLVAAAHRRIAAGDDEALLDAEDAGQQVGLSADGDRTCCLTADRIDLTDWLLGGPSAFPTTQMRLTVADAEPDQLEEVFHVAIDRLAQVNGAAAVLCPRDILSSNETRRERIVSAADRAGVMILVAPEYTPGMTIRAAGKLTRARTARQ
ncbi:SMI1/KNR4 family protein [Kutzneria albida]|uniref:Uncharacterized protein n=1 Tax=Kutzneria albida DSM 43870 TaxID=1449976 RepID=W5WK98_9PSEU|nr:SMI1/KNR4 family protein [Kutzneria albida]AHH98604.1 hypothetical protein KALB_5242 [Kutzneria albida DSM 43870]